MSKNLTIQENGVEQTLNTISVVETKGNPSGSVEWVPEDECQLGQVVVKSNGEITASEEGFYAFSKVSVNVPPEECKAVGMNDDGEWEVWGVDEDGELVELGLPTRIEVVTPPDKTSYIVGEPINPKGMVVMGYFEDDSEYGIINLDEITLDPMIAVSSGESGKTSDLIDFSVKSASSGQYVARSFNTDETYTLPDGDWEQVAVFVEGELPQDHFRVIEARAVESGGTYTHDGKSVTISTMYANYTIKSVFPPSIFNVLDNINRYVDAISWTMIYGTESEQKVTVKWQRQDGEELTTTFDITVNPILT